MDYTPKNPQPFTLEQARELEIPIIKNEISRLENSLSHLTRTQNELKEHLTGQQEEDKEVVEIMEENVNVIASQKERIEILNLALEQKGINARSPHYSSIVSQDTNHSADSIETPGPLSNRVEDDSRPNERAESETTYNGVYL